METTQSASEQIDPPNASDQSQQELVPDNAIPPEIVREVASRLKSLPAIMPYEEYAWIVHRVARLKWQCGEQPPLQPSSSD